MTESTPPTADSHELFVHWIRSLAAERRYGPDDRIGSLNLIDAAARLRAVEVLRTGESVGLCRPFPLAPESSPTGGRAYALDLYRHELGPTTVMAGDHVEFDCHGVGYTHVDALNHLAFDGTWYGGRSVADEVYLTSPSVLDLAGRGIFVRAIHVDVPRLRGVDWVEADEPVTAEDIERGIAAAGVTFERGDALLLDCGRDRFEEVHGPFGAVEKRGGAGPSAAEWLADAGPSLLCWDMIDVMNPAFPAAAVHQLHWAIGLVLVDNCDFTAARAALARHDTHVGALVVAPLPLPGGTGCNVNPQLLM
ncbi:cyclase family protein [Pseudonocardia oroxyli]|uniref:Putative cyclase n=1 Tax=Pseudonocardia oroxyli TaxID=366584 RepID=A0A1G7TME5_PSEOR|nr:cyclase family protein [Pseudonocardia oroxyli]SDG36507.1 Putative cyclase [Pseudonocardia oroxyli]